MFIAVLMLLTITIGAQNTWNDAYSSTYFTPNVEYVAIIQPVVVAPIPIQFDGMYRQIYTPYYIQFNNVYTVPIIPCQKQSEDLSQVYKYILEYKTPVSRVP